MKTKKLLIAKLISKCNPLISFRLLNLFLLMLLLSVNITNAQTKHTEEEEEEEKEGQLINGQQVMCGGTERWSQKVLVDNLVSTINFTGIPTTVNSLVNIVTPTPSTTMPRQPGIEDKTYTFTCNVTVKKAETDNDYHLVLSDGTHTLIGEIPDPVCSAAASSNYVPQYTAARNFVDTYIGSGTYSSVNIAAVQVYGVAFVDPPHGQTGAAPNNLEIHPILRINFIGTTDIEAEPQKQMDVSIFPNPFKDNITVNLTTKAANLKNCSIQFFDVMANKVAEFDLKTKSKSQIAETINTSQIAAGSYIYRIISDGKPIYDGRIISLPSN
ncbi:MAG TPA: T9SS type A sorting domain-containing protein [Bacteroidia bacterium]|nr:T9SS type A sorting domain-containing protein [Bacteroidia bacterium]